MTSSSKTIIGKVAYLEYRLGDQTNQHLFIPALPGRLSGDLIPARVMSRVTSKITPKRTWRTKVVSAPGMVFNMATASVTPIRDFEKAMTAVTPVVESIIKNSNMATDAKWVLTGPPVFMEITEDDATNIRVMKTPDGLLRRLAKARLDYKFPTEMWDKPDEDAKAVTPATNDFEIKSVYTVAPLDAALEAHVALALDNPAFADLLTLNSTAFPNVAKDMMLYSLGMVVPDVSTFLDSKITTGGHAIGRSASGADDDDNTEDTLAEGVDFATRANGERYYFRQWGDQHKDVMILQKAREGMHFPLLYGPPGTGKTAMTEAAFGEDLITVLCTGDTELSDLIGSYTPNPDGTYTWVNGPLIRAAVEGKVLLLDEIGVLDTKIAIVVYGLMDGRREYTVTANPLVGTVKAAPGFFVVGATNPNAPGVRLSEALLSRFSIHVEVATDYVLARRLGVDSKIVQVATHLDGVMRTGAIEWAPQFRELLAFRDLSAAFGREWAIQNMIASAPESTRSDITDAIMKVLSQQHVAAQIR